MRCEFSVGDIIENNYVIDSIVREDELSIIFSVSDSTGKFYFHLFKLWTLFKYERFIFAQNIV